MASSVGISVRFAKAEAYPDHTRIRAAGPSLAVATTNQTYPRERWFAQRFAPGDAVAYGIALDAQGKIARGDDPTSVVTRSS